MMTASRAAAAAREAIRTLAGVALFLAVACSAHAQAAAETARPAFEPQVGQAGKDVIWVPTPDAVVRRMLEMGRVGPRDYVVDLGSGDGRTVIAAVRDFGARALGVEYNPNMVELSRKAAAAARVSDRAQFRRADIFATDFSTATVVTLYLLPDLNLKLRPRILAMKPGTRVVSHSFTMGDWDADLEANVEGHPIYMWTVPARAGGRWTLQQPGGSIELSLSQSYQKLQGTARDAGGALQLSEARLAGEQITFVISGHDGRKSEYTGRVSGRQMQGTMNSPAGEAKWSAVRK